MKSISYLIVFLMIIITNNIIGQEKELVSDVKELSNAVIKVYYFHNTRRCATCQAVESVTKETLKESYSKELKNGTILFQSLNIEEDENMKLATELEISGQTLLFIKGSTQKDLTNDAFMYARSNPDKLKKKIKQFIGDI